MKPELVEGIPPSPACNGYSLMANQELTYSTAEAVMPGVEVTEPAFVHSNLTSRSTWHSTYILVQSESGMEALHKGLIAVLQAYIE